MDKAKALLKLISPTALEVVAGGQAFRLGQQYFDQGAVRHFSVINDIAHARVEGTQAYRVSLRIVSGKLSADCSCPRAGDGYFCKHCVAVGLAWLTNLGGAATTDSGANHKSRDPWRDIQHYLRNQEPDALIALVLDAARGDERLYRWLLQKAERGVAGADLGKIMRKAIDEATRVKDFVEWDEVDDLLAKLDDVVVALAELLRPGSSGVLVELLEYAIERVETMMEEVDDSDGGVAELVARMGELHLAACRAAAPEPVALAERLFQLEMTLPFGICDFDTRAYGDVLGEPGLQRYRTLALARWRAVKPRKAGDDDQTGDSSITRVMERLAEDSGDVDQLIDIKARNLSSCFHYLGIAELCHRAGRPGPALEWAERGLAAFPERTDNRLRDFLAGLYIEHGRTDEAVQLTWRQFEEQPYLGSYQKLALIAGKAGQWPAQRERALALLDASSAARPRGYGDWKNRSSQVDYSERVAVALWEEEIGTAWDYAQRGDCNRQLLITLAGKLEEQRLDDALALYRKMVPVLVDQTNNRAYEEARDLVNKMAKALGAQRRGAEMGVYLGQLRAEFKRKRNFIKLLDQFAGA